MSITSSIVTAQSLCPRKAFLLLYPQTSKSTDTPHRYVQILEERAKVNQAKHLAAIRQRAATACSSDATLLSSGADFLVNLTLRNRDLEAHCDVLTKVKTPSELGRHSYEPTIVVGTYSVTREQQTDLAFAGYVLGQIQKQLPVAGILLTRDERAHKIL